MKEYTPRQIDKKPEQPKFVPRFPVQKPVQPLQRPEIVGKEIGKI